MEFNFKEIEEKCKSKWAENQVYKVSEDPARPKYYVLDMFPYPSGSGLHVGHPLGYVASDIYARYKRLKGFNVLHPMGYDAFGLPAEQYAIETGTHPAITTENAIKRYREQLDKIGFSFDWSRQVKTCDPDYYKWTQWIFLKLFNGWYNRAANKAESIDTLIKHFEANGSAGIIPSVTEKGFAEFTAEQWSKYNDNEKQKILMNYRLAYLSFAEVNWCEALGTVLANDEVKDGKSERGGHPVERRRMRQWFLRITEYSDRLLEGLERLDWSEAMKDMQRNWIGRSEGALIKFHLSQTLSEGEGLKSSTKVEDGMSKPGYYTTDGQTWNHHLPTAKESRSNPTEAEAIVWERLRGKKTGFKFRRQHPIDRFIPDFVCLERGIIVEIDGKIHLQQQDQDQLRTEVLEKYGFEVLRFTNEEVIGNIDAVIAKITDVISKKPERTIPDEEASIRPSGTEDELKVSTFGGDLEGVGITVFTTRPDTIFGATFMVIAPEHELVEKITTAEQKDAIEKYIAYVKSRTDVERQQEKKVTGEFTGAYAINPFTNKPIPVYIAEYVLAGYGTGAIMAVPADDERDRKFAEKFGLPIVEIIDKSMYPGATIEDKVGKMINSDFLNGLEVKDAIKRIIDDIESKGIGQRKVNYKQRDAGYSRQRYWGEPFPIKYKVVGKEDTPFGTNGESDDIPVALTDDQLPLVLPEVSSFRPTGDGRAPLANNDDWVKNRYETDTMPGYAGSSWYFLRYMDANNPNEFAAKDKIDYWKNVDIYFGGAEHAVGHLLYSRMWHKFLFDLGLVPTDEPFQKLVNQGMIQGVSALLPTLRSEVGLLFISYSFFKRLDLLNSDFKNDRDKTLLLYFLKASGKVTDEQLEFWSKQGFDITFETRIPVDYTSNGEIDVDRLKASHEYYNEHTFIYDENVFTHGSVVEKMSKRYGNVVNPDDVVAKYGADCFRIFEMFLGPLEQSKPWDDKGISGAYNFLRKFWRLFYDDKGWKVSNEAATDAELKILHKALKKVGEDIERLSFNTVVSTFMIAVNELTSANCNKKEVLQPLVIAMAPLAPFITDELWEKLGNTGSVHLASYPTVEEKYLVESAHDYPVSINGKVRAQIMLPLDITQDAAQKEVLALEAVQKWTNGADPKKFIFVKGRIINLVV